MFHRLASRDWQRLRVAYSTLRVVQRLFQEETGKTNYIERFYCTMLQIISRLVRKAARKGYSPHLPLKGSAVPSPSAVALCWKPTRPRCFASRGTRPTDCFTASTKGAYGECSPRQPSHFLKKLRIILVLFGISFTITIHPYIFRTTP